MGLLQWKKEVILDAIFIEIEEGVVEEKNLERLEKLVDILHEEASRVPQSVKEAYCKVAVECTARCLHSKRYAKEAYTEAIRSIWIGRMIPLCDEVSCLVTSDLLNGCHKLWTAHNDTKACETLMDENTRDKALASLRKVVLDLHPNLDLNFAHNDRNEYMVESEESSEDHTGETEPMFEAREVEVYQGSLTDTEHEIPSGDAEAESPPCPIKTISSAVVSRASKIDLMNVLEKGGHSNLNITSITEQEHDVANPCATNKPQTYEWTDSIDDSDGATDGVGELNDKWRRISRIVVSPLKRHQGGRTTVPWSNAETLAVLKGYEKFGSNWKQIKDEFPILVRRTNCDIKDKFRDEMRSQERHP